MLRTPNTDGMFNKLVTVFISFCTQDKFVMVHVPGHAHLLANKFQYTLTVFWLRSALYHDTAPVHPTSYVTVDKIEAPIKLVPRSRQNSIKIVP